MGPTINDKLEQLDQTYSALENQLPGLVMQAKVRWQLQLSCRSCVSIPVTVVMTDTSELAVVTGAGS